MTHRQALSENVHNSNCTGNLLVKERTDLLGDVAWLSH